MVFANEINGRQFRHFAQPVYDEQGNVTHLVGFIAEVTGLVLAERPLADRLLTNPFDLVDLEALADQVS